MHVHCLQSKPANMCGSVEFVQNLITVTAMTSLIIALDNCIYRDGVFRAVFSETGIRSVLTERLFFACTILFSIE